MKAAEKKALVADLVASAADVGYTSGTAFADAVKCISDAHRFASSEDYERICGLFRAGRVVAYIERPPLSVPTAERKAIATFVDQHWANYDRAQRFEAALALIALPPSKSDKPERRTRWQDGAVNAARSALSTARANAGIKSERTGKGGRKPRPGSNPPDNVSVSVGSPKFSNDNEAREHFRNVLAALATTCEINQQTGAPKSVKGVAFRVQTIILDARKAIEAALAE